MPKRRGLAPGGRRRTRARPARRPARGRCRGLAAPPPIRPRGGTRRCAGELAAGGLHRLGHRAQQAGRRPRRHPWTEDGREADPGGLRQRLRCRVEHRRLGTGAAGELRVQPGHRAVGGLRPGARGGDDGAQGGRRRRLRRPGGQPALGRLQEAQGGRRRLEGRGRPDARDRPDDLPGAAVRRPARGPGPGGLQRHAGLCRDRGRGGVRRRAARSPSVGRGLRHGRTAGRPGQRDALGQGLRLHRPRHVAGRRGRPGRGRTSWCRKPVA